LGIIFFDESLPCCAVETHEALSKEGEPYITFCSWEAASYIRDHIRFEQSRGETIKPSSYVFTAQDAEEPLSISRLDYLRAGYLKALNSLFFLKEPRGMEIINGVARQRIEELEGRLAALEDAVKFYETLLKHIERRNLKLLREPGLRQVMLWAPLRSDYFPNFL
jgi:hypothetical protein